MTKFQIAVLVLLAAIAGVVFFCLVGLGGVLYVQSQPVSQPAAQVPPTATPEPTTPPTATPLPTPIGDFNSFNEMVRGIVGSHLQNYEIYDIQDLNGPEWEDDGGVFIDIYLKDAHSISRSELQEMAYALQYAGHKQNPTYLSITLFTPETRCALGIGIGSEAAPKFLPDTPPSDINAWFQKLVRSGYYADRPGQRDELLAYANDTRKPACDDYPEWK